MKSPLNDLRRARPLLGTIVEVGAQGANASTGIEAAFREIEIVHHLMSFHEPSSDISRINCASPGTIVRIDRRTYEVIAHAQFMSRLSKGAFDITVGGKLVQQGILPRPQESELLDRNASYEDIVLLSDQCVTLRRRAWIDLGGIAKGFAVDCAVTALEKSGVVSGIVNAGGDLFAFGDPQPVCIRHPVDPSRIFQLGMILNSAVASSSGCFSGRRQDGAAADPLVEPRRNHRRNWRVGVTVLASRCITADALTKVVRLAPRTAPTILSQLGARALIINRRGVHISQGDEREAIITTSSGASRLVCNEPRHSNSHGF
jgi:FAD:protein FMN transferase